MKEKSLAEILTPKIIGVSSETSVAEAMDCMRREGISCILILEDERPIGIVTERNIVALAADLSARLDQYQITELMSKPVVTAHERTGLYEAYHILEQHHIRHLVVVNDAGASIGMVTQSNILANLDYDYYIEVKRIRHAMTKNVICVQHSLPVQQAMILMKEEAAGCVVVVDGKRPVGIMTERDAARVLLDNEDIILLPVNMVMTKDVFSVTEETPLHAAVQIMQQHKIRRLVVVDQNGDILGLATQSDVVKGLEGRYISKLNQIIREQENHIESTEKDLIQKTTYLDNILRSSVDNGIIAVDLNYQVVYFNPAAERILGFAASKVIGRDLRSIHQEMNLDTERIQQALQKIHQKSSFAFELMLEENGRQKFIQARASAILDHCDELTGVFLMVNDITEKKQAEIKLRAAHDGLEKRVQERTTALSKAMEGAIEAMALTVEMRDPYTSGHQRRVAILAAAIGREMGLEEKTIEGIYMAGLIHDIGKIRVPSGILCNPGRLSEAEFGILKPHPEIGYNILKGIEFPWPIADIVLQHHERLDGTGYPKGLKNGEILLEARVLAVADVVEAMYSHRPYRPSLGLDRAIAEIRQKKDNYYDPDVVSVCVRILEKEQFSLPSSFRPGEWLSA